MAAQTVQGNPEQPVTIQFEWSAAARPEWLPTVTVNQQVNHITTTTDRDEIRQLIDGKTRCSELKSDFNGSLSCDHDGERT